MTKLCRKCKNYRKGRCLLLGTSPEKHVKFVYNYVDMSVTYKTTVVKCSKFEPKEV